MYTHNIFLHEDKAKEQGGVSLDLLQAMQRHAIHFRKKLVDVTGYFLPSNETYYSLAPSSIV